MPAPIQKVSRPWLLMITHPLTDVDESCFTMNNLYLAILIINRYQIDRGVIVIPKSVTKSRIASNFDVFDFKLAQEDLDLIDSFDCNGRLVPMTA